MDPREKYPENTAGPCVLCDRMRTLVASHIVPEFWFKFVYDDKHRAYPVRFREGSFVQDFQIQKGFRWPLMCQDCEGLLNTHVEQPVHSNIKGILSERTAELLRPRELKLYLISIIWRCYWSGVRKGPLGIQPKAHYRLFAEMKREIRRAFTEPTTVPEDFCVTVAWFEAINNAKDFSEILQHPRVEIADGFEFFSLSLPVIRFLTVLSRSVVLEGRAEGLLDALTTTMPIVKMTDERRASLAHFLKSVDRRV